MDSRRQHITALPRVATVTRAHWAHRAAREETAIINGATYLGHRVGEGIALQRVDVVPGAAYLRQPPRY